MVKLHRHLAMMVLLGSFCLGPFMISMDQNYGAIGGGLRLANLRRHLNMAVEQGLAGKPPRLPKPPQPRSSSVKPPEGRPTTRATRS
jgi:hypothetical protein